MDILYQDNSILVCIKPAGVLSTDEPGGVPELVRQALGDPNACVRTVHRLDRVVSGLMVLARTPAAASKLSAQIREHDFGKTYLAVVHGEPDALQGTYRDLLRARPRRAQDRHEQGWPEGVQEAVLDYDVLGTRAEPLTRAHLSADRAHAPDPLPVFVAWSAALGGQKIQHAARRRADRALVALPALCPPGHRRGALFSSSSRRTLLHGTCLQTKIPRRGAGGSFCAGARQFFVKTSCNQQKEAGII